MSRTNGSTTIRKSLFQVVTASLILLLAACQTAQNPPQEDISIPVIQPLARSAPEVTAVAGSTPSEGNPSGMDTPVYSDLWSRIIGDFQLQSHYDMPDVDDELRWYVNNQQYFDRISLRASPFLFWIVSETERRGLPAELVLLPIIESAFEPNAVSSEKAVGLWQIVAPTASNLGLAMDWWYDGRKDPLASTNAALDYLEYLYQQFDQDWLLSLAAYNAGEGNLRRAIRREGSEQDGISFWDLRLPAETRAHVPRLLAMAKLMAHAGEYGVSLPEIPNQPYFAEIDPGFQVDLEIAASTLGMEADALRELNPGYLQWATHPDRQQSLLVPLQVANSAYGSLQQIPADQRITWSRYQIKPGDTLIAIARRLGTSVEVIRRVNGINGSRIIAGRSLLIPRTDISNPDLLPSLANVAENESLSVPASYRVRRGDNLWDIARRFNLHYDEIAQWNEITPDAPLHPGQILLLHDNGQAVETSDLVN